MVRMSVSKTEQLIDEVTDYADDGTLKGFACEEYYDKHSEVKYPSENDNYDLDDEDD